MPRKPSTSRSTLRVVGGSARGRRLISVPGSITRPVTDRVKEAVFNIIGPDIQDARLLDLFAGSGAIGIEALSRGAAFVQFNDLNRLPAETIKENLRLTGFNSSAEISRFDAFRLLERKPEQAFEYVYIAPPQYKGMWREALYALDSNAAWLSQDAWVIVQIHPIEYEPCSDLNCLEEFDNRRYGSTMVMFFQRK